MSVVIKAENISKQYRLGLVGGGTLRDDVSRWWSKIRGKEDPLLKIGESNDRTSKGDSDYVWSLKGINFEVNQGDILGIVGRNGAGKSTLLKVLSQVTGPTTGNIRVKGRIASLLEVGTGFHPELTGRENIFLNGAILGMRKSEIKRKMDEIVDFAGVERYIDTPVKRYSSGMYVRLAFAVAAHLESEILVVDEVLAVGDAEFQKKCIGKMSEISQGEGRTVLFVSHNMSAVRNLCTRAIMLKHGELVYDGSVQDTLDHYLADGQTEHLSSEYFNNKDEEKEIQLTHAVITDSKGEQRASFEITEDIYITAKYKVREVVPNVYGYVAISTSQEEIIVESDTYDFMPNVLNDLKLGENVFKLKIPAYTLATGDFLFHISLASTFANKFNLDSPGDVLKFAVVDNTTQRGHNRKGKTSCLLKWEPVQ